MNVIVLPQAQQDALDAAGWYESKSSGLGDEFLDELDAALADISTDPERLPELELPVAMPRLIRRRLMHRFQHLVVFEVADDLVRIVAVWHPSRCRSGSA